MDARRAVKAAKKSDDADAIRAARDTVHQAKVALGERGPTWWADDEDQNRKLIKNSPYADWWTMQSLDQDQS